MLAVPAVASLTLFALALTGLDGRTVQPLSSKISVFIFTRTDCPISNRYAPEIRRIYDRFAAQGASIWLVYVNPAESTASIREHLREYAYPESALLDPRHQLVRLTGARSTPEAAVFSSGKLVYRGRIDDRYTGLGQMRPAANTHDLEQVLDALVAGKRLEFRETRAIGCFIDDLK